MMLAARVDTALALLKQLSRHTGAFVDDDRRNEHDAERPRTPGTADRPVRGPASITFCNLALREHV